MALECVVLPIGRPLCASLPGPKSALHIPVRTSLCVLFAHGGGPLHKPFWICELKMCRNGQILNVKFFIKFENAINNGKGQMYYEETQ